MQTFQGIIRVRHVNPGSKSEGTAAWLEPEGEAEPRRLRLYRSGMPDTGDPLFAGLDGRAATVVGEEEAGGYLRVEGLTAADAPAGSASATVPGGSPAGSEEGSVPGASGAGKPASVEGPAAPPQASPAPDPVNNEPHKQP